MIHNQFIELVAVSGNWRIVESALGNSEGENFGAVAEGNIPHPLQGLVDIICFVFHGYIVCAAQNYGPVIRVVGVDFFIWK